ncbi:MAG: hypothetical protein QW592_01575 [Candidatus Bathyarchaeia archaeon]
MLWVMVSDANKLKTLAYIVVGSLQYDVNISKILFSISTTLGS